MDRGIVSLGDLSRFAQVFKRAENGEKLTVGFLGGSITQDSAATKHENCYAYRTFSWWKEKFPTTEFQYINAGIGATTSQFGVARVEEDLLSMMPDIVICEFSVNDSNNEFYKETFESLIRRILSAKSQPALLTFNNVVYDTGENAQEVHNEIAMHYELPVVSMKDSIYEEIQLGNLVRESITTDNLHPNDLGHKLVSQVLRNCLNLLYEKYTEGIQSTEEASLKAPLTANRYEASARVRGTQKMTANEGFVQDESEQYGVRDVFKRGFTAQTEGAAITYRVAANKISIQYRKTIKHPAPEAEVLVDGQKVATLVSDFEETWGDCLYLQDVWEDSVRFTGVSGQEAAEHEVMIRLTEVPENAGAPFYFVSLILA